MKIEGIKGAIRIQLGLILDYPTGRPDKVEYITEDGKGWRELEVKGSWFNEAFIGTMGGLMKKLEDPALPERLFFARHLPLQSPRLLCLF